MEHLPKNRNPRLWLLAVASSLSPFGMAIVVPSLGSIADRFEADFGFVQFVISAYLLGLGLAQPICGYLCDRFGRRPVMLTGFAVFTIASIFCAYAPTLGWLSVARFVQAAGVSVGTVASRAILRDTRDKNDMAQAMSYISAATGVAPITAPVIGGLLDFQLGYSSTFIVSAVIGAMVFFNMLMKLPETINKDHGTPKVRDWLKSYRYLLSSRVFLGNTFVFGFVQGGFFCFLSIGAVLFASEFQYSPAEFGLLWGVLSICYVIGAAAGGRLTPVLGTQRVMNISIALNLATGLIILITGTMGELTVLKIIAPLGFLMIFAGATTPGALTGAVASHPTIAGTASGLSSAIGLVIGGSFSVLTGTVYDGQYSAVAIIILLTCCATGLSWLLATVRPPPDVAPGTA